MYLFLFKDKNDDDDDQETGLKEYCRSLPALEEFRGMPLLWTDEWRNKLPPATKRSPPSLHIFCF
jgi:hypothetical protein